MANYKRKKPRRYIRCLMCTDGRQGNSLKDLYGSNTYKIRRQVQIVKEQVNGCK